MQEASFSGLLKTIFWIIIIYYAIRFLAKLFLPIVAKKMVEKASEQFQQQNQQYQNQQHNQQENPNQTNIKSDKPREKNKVGEYIDYEELD